MTCCEMEPWWISTPWSVRCPGQEQTRRSGKSYDRSDSDSPAEDDQRDSNNSAYPYARALPAHACAARCAGLPDLPITGV